MNSQIAYPQHGRSKWVLERRPARSVVDPTRPHAFLVEPERNARGEDASTATIFLTNRECPWRCVMCDLWRNTLEENTPLGAIPAQITFALQNLPASEQLKLYNSGSFFDEKAIPRADYPAIAALVGNFHRVIVECHPRMLEKRCLEFLALLRGPRLEVAIGLETADPETLALLNKGMDLDDYINATQFLRNHQIDLRTFLLAPAPFRPKEEGLDWVKRSISFAFDYGSSVVSLIPTRTGNGAMEQLREAGLAPAPTLADLAELLRFGLDQRRGRVFVDLWDLALFSRCPDCFSARRADLEQMNRTQLPVPVRTCPCCPS